MIRDVKTWKRTCRRCAASIAAGTAAAAALTVGALFDSAEELLAGAGEAQPVTEAAAVELKTAAAHPQTLRERLRAFFLRQNALLRGAVLLPLWAAGKALLTLLSLLSSALSPYWGAILGVLLNALLLIALFGLTYKGLFPDAKLTDLFKKKRWLWLLGGALLLAAADAVLKLYWPDYSPISIFIKLFCGFVVLAALCFRIFGPKSAKTVQ